MFQLRIGRLESSRAINTSLILRNQPAGKRLIVLVKPTLLEASGFLRIVDALEQCLNNIVDVMLTKGPLHHLRLGLILKYGGLTGLNIEISATSTSVEGNARLSELFGIRTLLLAFLDG